MAECTFLPGGGLTSSIMSLDGSFYLFTFFNWGWSEVQHLVLRQLTLPIYLFTFLPGGDLWPRIRPQKGSFYLFTLLPFYLGVVCDPESGLKMAHFTFLPF